jgi:S1/P1 Nuclease
MHRLLFAFFLLLLPKPAFAWWEYGHYTVANVAMREIKPATRAKIVRLIRASPALDTPECPVTNIEQASYWPDCIKQYRDRFSYASAWHYQNVDICKPFDLTAACKDGNCVSAQVTRNAKLLADPKLPRRERLMALAFLIHFVGDLHMPLHAGDKNDRGGNDLKASYGAFAGSRLNLHAVWDGYLAERAISTPPAGASGLILSARSEMALGTVADWSRESWQVAREAAYVTAIGDPCGPVPARAALDETQIARLIPVVREQVLRGGMRLARLLDEALP